MSATHPDPLSEQTPSAGEASELLARYEVRNGEPRVWLSPHSVNRRVGLDSGSTLLGYPSFTDRTPVTGSELDTGVLTEVARGETHLDGTWSLVMQDGEDLAIRTDPYGSRPLFWQHTVGSFSVAETIWPLIGRASVDPIGIADFLLVGHHLGSSTLFGGVQQTEADTILRVGGSGALRETIPRRLVHPEEMSLEEAMDRMESDLTGVLAPYSHLSRLVISLSGGLDSRVLAALAVEQGFDVQAWTHTLATNSFEEDYARRVATTLGIEHTVTRDPLHGQVTDARAFIRATSGQVSVEHMHGFASGQDAPRHGEIMIDGVNGDIICGGSFLLPRTYPASEFVDQFTSKLVRGLDPYELQTFLPGVPDWADRLRRLVVDWFELAGEDPGLSDLLVLRYRPGRFNVFGGVSARAHGFEYGQPFLDRSLVTSSLVIPERYRRGSVAYRQLIERRWPELAAIPWAKTGHRVTSDPGTAGAFVRRARARLPRQRPLTFTHERRLVYPGLSRLVTPAVSVLRPLMNEIGLDIDALLARYPASTFNGRAYRLRLISLALTFGEAGMVSDLEAP